MDGFWGIVIIFAFLGLLPAGIAASKGRSFGAWWVYGFLIFIVALIHSLVLESKQHITEEKKINLGEIKKCPFCAESIKAEAIVCKHCNKEIPAIYNVKDIDLLSVLSSQKLYFHKNGGYELDDATLMIAVQRMKDLGRKITDGEYVKFIEEFGKIILSIQGNLPEQLKDEFDERYRYWMLK
ncbi:zinc ribbon domain-containing protein [Xenorhabdus lircayensis]|uniref:Zinc ribbon domain-containing protein n=1 Tax=Xenorhabdus lircayensis TaxID=2763499 RepID=A0ABS0UBS7_9GAMM|nr:zinc ribbon domain-containing protein [Xenorhabdus lircayensis]MBI6550206.1 zinc ribbon domain-containing protein [Xenorhabdus lircayensis]